MNSLCRFARFITPKIMPLAMSESGGRGTELILYLLLKTCGLKPVNPTLRSIRPTFVNPNPSLVGSIMAHGASSRRLHGTYRLTERTIIRYG
jgi:hypothetical protein